MKSQSQALGCTLFINVLKILIFTKIGKLHALIFIPYPFGWYFEDTGGIKPYFVLLYSIWSTLPLLDKCSSTAFCSPLHPVSYPTWRSTWCQWDAMPWLLQVTQACMSLSHLEARAWAREHVSPFEPRHSLSSKWDNTWQEQRQWLCLTDIHLITVPCFATASMS